MLTAGRLVGDFRLRQFWLCISVERYQTEENLMKKFSVRTIAAIGIGAALFFVLGRFDAIPGPVPNTTISVQYGLLAFLAALYGPVVGALIGFIGHALVDFSWGWGVWWSWVIASAVFGALVGVATGKLALKSGKIGKKELVRFNIAQVICHVICWGCVAPALDILIYSEPLDKLFAQGLVAGVSNSVTTAVIGSLLCAAYALTRTGEGSPSRE